jgi:hypothetical protein
VLNRPFFTPCNGTWRPRGAVLLGDQEVVRNADDDVCVSVRQPDDEAVARPAVPFDLERQPQAAVRPRTLAAELEREAAHRRTAVPVAVLGAGAFPEGLDWLLTSTAVTSNVPSASMSTITTGRGRVRSNSGPPPLARDRKDRPRARSAAATDSVA